jgi:two-component system cell cycle response regulator DivK
MVKDSKKANGFSNIMPLLLVVDDNVDTPLLVKAMVSSHGFEVMVALTGQEALTLARQTPPDVVLMDIMLPESQYTGWETIGAFKEDATLASIPIIATTASGKAEDKNKAEALGCVGFLPKPFMRQELLMMLEKVLPSPS